MMIKVVQIRRRILNCSAAAAAVASLAPQIAHAQSGSQRIAIASQPLSTALTQLARQADIDIVAPTQITNGKVSPAVGGDIGAEQALNRLLINSGLRYRRTGNGYVIERIALLTAFRAASTPAAAAVSSNSSAPEVQPREPETPVRDEAGSDAIVVTGTRVIRDGYEAPTPTSVIGAEEIARNAPANIADFVNQMPALAASSTARANVGFVSAGLVGINALNLRSLGENRTLVLLDGQRVGASTLTGLVDINQFPEALIKRVDVVTGGASADWGSDAVAGVVNFILDKSFTGLKGTAQGGVTTYGDDRNFKISLTGGTGFADDRGHILISGLIAHNEGINGIGKRSWYNGAKIILNPAYAAGNGLPQYLSLPNVGYLATPGGLIVSGPLRGTYFGENGTPLPYQFGIVSGINNQGGNWPYDDIGTVGDLNPESSRQNIFARVSFDVSDHIQIFAEGSYARARVENTVIPYLGLNRTIQPDNAFLPASLAAQVSAPFTLSTFAGDLGPITAATRRSAWKGVIGAKGDFNAFGSSWTWDIYAQKSITHAYVSAYLPITANFASAIDAVHNPSGVIICRSTLANPNNGCVPFNVFGTGVNSQTAVNYINGTAWIDNRLTEQVVAGTLRGDAFSTWAGPVSIAAGMEHRREGVSGVNDPLSTTNSYFAGNYHASFGSYNVTEGFLEAVVPLAKNVPFADTLDLNAAIRATDYSTSGFVTTWKLGLTYSPTRDVTFRIIRSRDIRAPNLAELYQSGQTQTQFLTDPTRGNASSPVFLVTQGNSSLKPEQANSFGLGVVLQPSFLPGFAASVDYYRIDIRNAISTVSAQIEVNQCAAGNTVFCSQITRDATGTITTVQVSPINFAEQKARGLDFEASYRHSLLQGTIGFRIMATRYLKNYFDNGISAPTDTVGTNGLNVALRNSLPKWRYTATLAWDRKPVSLSLTARGFSAGLQNTSYVQCSSGCPVSTVNNPTINDNHVPGAIYFDTNATVQLGNGIETFVSVDNLLNKDPAQVAYGPGIATAPISVNQVLFDTFGRTFRMGVRFKM